MVMIVFKSSFIVSPKIHQREVGDGMHPEKAEALVVISHLNCKGQLQSDGELLPPTLKSNARTKGEHHSLVQLSSAFHVSTVVSALVANIFPVVAAVPVVKGSDAQGPISPTPTVRVEGSEYRSSHKYGGVQVLIHNREQ